MKRKLTLARETIRSLTGDQLRDAAGGTTHTFPACDTWQYTECEGCSNNCPKTDEQSICYPCITEGETCDKTCPPCSNCDCFSEGGSACTSQVTC